MTNDRIFGYGSLVNADTHSYGKLQPAVLAGWRRCWHFTRHRDLAYLSIAPDATASIKGVLLDAPSRDIALANRERAYSRHNVTPQISPKTGDTVHVYAIPITARTKRSIKSTLLLSYIDVVVQGYFQMFGAPSVQQFFQTTQGWGAPILNDRPAPRYPRHQHLSLQETALVDDALKAMNAPIIQL